MSKDLQWYHRETVYDAIDKTEGFTVEELQTIFNKHPGTARVYVLKKTWQGTLKKIGIKEYTYIGSITESRMS